MRRLLLWAAMFFGWCARLASRAQYNAAAAAIYCARRRAELGAKR